VTARRGVLVATLLLAMATALTGCASPGTAGSLVPGATAPAGADTGRDAGPAPADLVAAASLVPCPASGAAAPAAGGLPDVALRCLGSGPRVRLSGVSGPLVVNVWQSDCAPCRAELATLQEFAASTPGVRVLGVDVEDDPGSALSLLAAVGAHYPVVRDDAGVTRSALQWGPGLPATLFVDTSGRIAYVHHGALEGPEQLRSLVAEHLGATAS
jgi:thiol-disulfide isomerase/thioredoxin